LKGIKINTGVTKKKITKNKDNDKTNQFRSGGDEDDEGEGGDLDEQNQKIAEQDAEAAEAAEKDENGNEAQEP